MEKECSECLKRPFFSFSEIFEWRSWNLFQENWGKVSQSVGIKVWSWEASYKMILEQPSSQKRIFWAIEKSIFQFFANFWVMKLKPFPEKVGEGVKIYLNKYFFIITFLENGFGDTLRSKTNVLSVWKRHFSDFCETFWVKKLKRFPMKVG